MFKKVFLNKKRQINSQDEYDKQQNLPLMFTSKLEEMNKESKIETQIGEIYKVKCKKNINQFYFLKYKSFFN